MTEFNTIHDLAKSLQTKINSNTNKKKIVALYAFNATGKTRLSVEFDNLNDNKKGEVKNLSYNAFLEDLFVWDNNDYILKFNANSWVVSLIKDQGLEGKIIDNFNNIITSKIEPSFDFDNGKVTFQNASGDDANVANIKISKSEESILIWSIFFTILEIAIETLNEVEENRTTSQFNNLEYIFIDDPVSSIDDTRIITMAIKLISTINYSNKKDLKILITTHHALYYNILHNAFRRNGEYKYTGYILSKNRISNSLELKKQKNDTPFAYHFVIIEEIKRAITENDVQKFHFNLFRSLLEKTANFLGYSNWTDCISGSNKGNFIKLINLYSHNRLSELEYRELSNEERDVFKEVFNKFIEEFKYKIN